MSKKKKSTLSNPFEEIGKCTLNIRKENERHILVIKELNEKRDNALREYKKSRKEGG